MFTSSAFLRRSRLGRRAALTAAGARVFAAAFAAALALGLPPAAAQPAPKFKVVTTFTVIADMARNVAGKFTNTSPRRAIWRARKARSWCCGTG